MASIGDLVARVLLDSTSWDQGIEKMRGKLTEFEGQAEKSKTWTDAMNNAGTALIGVGGALTGVSAAFGLVGAASIKASEGINTARIGFTTMLGSAEAADKMLRDIQKFAATTPFEFPDLVTAAQKMKALGFESDKIIPTLRTVGDTAAAMGKGKESIDLITLALGQMQAKGKASAQEMNQLAEQGIPAWEILAKAIGVSIPEAMKLAEKGAIDGRQAVQVILEGLNSKFAGSMDQMSKTLTGMWSNFQDSLKPILTSIGQSLTPILQSLLPLLTSMAEKVAAFAKWFSELDAPVRNAALALGAVLAAIGPLTLGIGGLLTLIGTITPGLVTMAAALAPLGLSIGGVTVAVAAVVAGLALLGTWIAQNWEPIVATLKAAWDGIAEAWNAVWGVITGVLSGIWSGYMTLWHTIWDPVIAVVLTLWDAVAPYFTTVWNTIKGALESVWNGIKAVAETVWGAITGAISTFLEWAAKIPGVSKLMKLDDVWKDAEKAADKLKEQATATKKVGEAAKTTGITIKASAEEQEKAAKKAAAAQLKHDKMMADGWDAAQKRYADQQKEFEKTLNWFTRANQTISDNNEKIDAQNQKLSITFAAAQEKIRAEALKTVEVIVPAMQRIPPEIAAAIQKNTDLEQSFKDLGIKSAAELNTLYQKAKEAYDNIKNSGMAAPRDIDAAWVAMETARQNAVVAAGGQVEAAHKKTLDNMKAALDTHKTDQETAWSNMATQVSTTISNFAQDMAKSLFEGDLSFGEKAKGMLKSLGAAVATSFIEPATAAISTFIEGVLKDLLGGKGLGGISERLSTIGDSFGKIFGGDKGGVPSVPTGGDNIPGVPSAPTSGGGGGLGGFLSGGLFGNLLSAGTMISSIIGNFQNARQETTLNAIEESTRRTLLYVGDRADGGILGVAFRVFEELAYGTLVKAAERTRDVLFDWTGVLTPICETIRNTLNDNLPAQTDLLGGIYDATRVVGDSIMRLADRPININVSPQGLTTAEAARALGNQIARNMTTQFAPVL